jgi:hypothetical protein
VTPAATTTPTTTAPTASEDAGNAQTRTSREADDGGYHQSQSRGHGEGHGRSSKS